MLTRSNYESFFLDYHEGNLSEALKAELFAFLEQHPDLKEEFEQFAAITLEPEPVVFANKDSLLKRASRVDAKDTEQLIALHEGDLSAADARNLQSRIEQDPVLKQESELIARLRIEPDLAIRFPDLNSLKKGGRVIAFRTRVYQSLSIAAAIVVMLLAYVYFRTGEQPMTADRQSVPNGAPATQQSESIPATQQQSPTTQFAGLPVDTSRAAVQPRLRSRTAPAGEQAPAYAQQAPVKRPIFEGPKQQPEGPAQQQQQPEPSQVNTPLQEPVYAQQTPTQAQPVRPAGSVHNTESLADIFSDQELAELGLREQPAGKDGQVWKLVEKGARKIGEATGSDVTVDRQSDPVTQSNTYALAIGKFSIRRSGR